MAIPSLSRNASLLLGALLASACSNGGMSNYYANNPTSRGLTTYSALSTGDTGYVCPSQANVLPYYDTHFDGSDRFTVCLKSGTPTDLSIHGRTSESGTICVFPVQYYDQNHIYTKPDLATGAPMSQCIQVSSQGVYASFDKLISFNAVIIVEQPEVAQMTTCLIGGNWNNCPQNYSYGLIK